MMSQELWDAACDRITETNEARTDERERIRRLIADHAPATWPLNEILNLIGDPL